MRISHRYRFVFLSIPRTASRTIRSLLDEYSDIKSVNSTRTSKQSPFYHHMPANEAKLVFDDKGWDWFDYHRFCVVRNPYARMVSLYHYYLNMRRRIVPGLAPIPKLKAIVKYKVLPRQSFSEYVLRPHKTRKVAMPLDDFIFDDSGACLVDDIIMYEKLAEDLPPYLQRIGIDVDALQFPVVGASDIRSYGEYYDEETKRFVGELCQYSIDRFGYRFEDLE